VTIVDKLPAYRVWFEAMPGCQLARVIREMLSLAQRYLPENPEKAEAHYAVAGLDL
jgi:hypothetical protein